MTNTNRQITIFSLYSFAFKIRIEKKAMIINKGIRKYSGKAI